MLVALGAPLLPIATCNGQEAKSTFAVEPIIDGGEREMAQVKGLRVEGQTRFPIPKSAEVLEFPNGELAEVNNDWPNGGWGRFEPAGFAALMARVSYANAGSVIKPVDYAEAAGMPVGELDFILARMSERIDKSLWDRSALFSPVTLLENVSPNKGNALRIPSEPGALLRTPNFPIPDNAPYFLSFWARTDVPTSGVLWMNIENDTRSGSVQFEFLEIPDTKGQWRRLGFYLDGRPGIVNGRLLIPGGKNGTGVELAGFEVRGALDTEMIEATRADRKAFPPNVTSPKPGDGRHLGLSKAKLAGKAGVPGRPFVVWAIGSSWTAGLGRGEALKAAMRESFPDGPEIVYYGRMGSGAPYNFVRGWAMTGVAKDQPDLVISYTNGTAEGLEEMLKSIRSLTTADIIIPSLHFLDNKPLSNDVIEPAELDALRKICEKYGAQFVENRRELADFLIANDMEPGALLRGPKDVHQNRLGALLTNENIIRHLLAPLSDGEFPEGRERLIDLTAALSGKSKVEGLRFVGKWRSENGFVIPDGQDASIELEFTGNRLDLLGEAKPGGGKLVATVNGDPLEKLNAFSVSIIKQPDTNAVHGSGPTPRYPRSTGGSQATGPHGVLLGKNIVPQDWRFEMIDNKGNFRLIGSKTGPDGEGNVLEPWTSKSGQIILDPRLWRYGNMKELKRPEVFSNHPGDYWPFTVTREVSGPISFLAETPKPIDTTVFKLAPNTLNKVTLRASGGPVYIKALVTYRPPLTIEKAQPGE